MGGSDLDKKAGGGVVPNNFNAVQTGFPAGNPPPEFGGGSLGKKSTRVCSHDGWVSSRRRPCEWR